MDGFLYPLLPRQLMKFPMKLWSIINDDKSDSISWGPEGTSIIVQYSKFQQEYLNDSGVFKTSQMTSFIRQLNLYGFRKLNRKDIIASASNQEQHEFCHEFFVRGREDLLVKIRRTSHSNKKVKVARNIPGSATLMETLHFQKKVNVKQVAPLQSYKYAILPTDNEWRNNLPPIRSWWKKEIMPIPNHDNPEQTTARGNVSHVPQEGWHPQAFLSQNPKYEKPGPSDIKNAQLINYTESTNENGTRVSNGLDKKNFGNMLHLLLLADESTQKNGVGSGAFMDNGIMPTAGLPQVYKSEDSSEE